MISSDGDQWFITEPGTYFPDFKTTFFANPVSIPYEPTFKLGRAKQWKFCDYDGDGVRDLIIGASDWSDYGWDDAFNEKGEWTNDVIHGYIYVMRNTGSNDAPVYAEAMQLQAGDKPLDVYGCPSPNFVDIDKDGDLDIIAGEFLDRISYFENTGSRTEPRYAPGRFLQQNGKTLHLDLEMLQVVVVDWNRDGNPDIFVGKEDGRVVLMLGTGAFNGGVPRFTPPRYLQQEAAHVKVGTLTTPYSVDWDGDGDEDIIAGDTAGYINFVENLGGGANPIWAKPVYLQADGKTIRIQAGPNGSIQGPAEAKWGYTVLNVADWDHDGLLDVVINSIWGKIQWYKNVGEAGKPQLAKAQPIDVAWEGPTPKPAWFWWNPKGKHLVTQWRTSPVVQDINGDGLNDLIMLDQEGYLAFFERSKDGDTLVLNPPQRIFKDEKGEPLRLNSKNGGGSGRRKFVLYDWDQDGKRDLLINSKNIDFMRNIAEKEGEFQFKNEGLVDPHQLAGHTTCPAIVDWDGNGVGDLLVGAEDGFFYYLENTNQP
ncbi:MAG: VCBS repeat-containing protein [Candidatus Hydrogenedentes bacterium]|nr:VCBS repeat-containing protein [Candidatus Hydrogenedentota bacterium]